MSIHRIQTGWPSCCRDLAFPVGLLRKTDREETSQPQMHPPSPWSVASLARPTVGTVSSVVSRANRVTGLNAICALCRELIL
jgi:hypothetical protein